MDRNAVELFASKPPGRAWKPMHGELRNVFGPHLRCTSQFQGHSRWLVLFGAGALVNNVARIMQLKGGGRALLWDLGYWGNRHAELRMSIDSDHPQQWLDRTPSDPWRWDRRGIQLREDHDPRGPILLVGLGRKSRLYLNAPHWERDQLARLRFEFPGSRIIYRPKPDNGRNSYPVLDCETNVETGIEQLLKGAALVVCRHSNVGVDAVIAGVPVRTEDGAAAWLNDKPFTPEVRLEFLRRLAWWQWSPNEAREAWQFARRITECA
jgi:hypothetical protein